MRKQLLHVLIISIVFLYSLMTQVAEASRGMEPVLIRDSQGKQVGLYKASYALVIGIDNYTKGWSRLRNAVKDADMISEELEKQGFDVTLRKDLTGEELRKELRQFFVIKGSNPDARLLSWFSGHGHTIDGEGFLVPADAPVPTSNQFMVTSLHMRDFGGLVRLAKSKHVLSVFDSCFAGTIFNTRAGIPSPAITRATALPVRQFLTSGDAGQQVSDDGSFRELFLRAIRGEEWADANKDSYLTGSELGNYLSDRVTNLTNAAQIPRHGKLFDVKYDRGDFVFALDRDVYEPPVPEEVWLPGLDETTVVIPNHTDSWNRRKAELLDKEYKALEVKLKDGEYSIQAKLDSLYRFRNKWKTQIEESGLSTIYLKNIERYNEYLNRLRQREIKRGRQLAEFERVLSTEYADMLKKESNKYIEPKDKVEELNAFLLCWEERSKEYDRGLDKIATIKRRLEYWRNRNPSPSPTAQCEQEREENPLLSQVVPEADQSRRRIQPDRQVTNLRSSFRDLSVSQVQSMSNISICKKCDSGFYGHSTIIHRYEKKSIKSDKVVIGHATGLMWHPSGSDEYMWWKNAEKWVKKLNRSGYAGYHDWRLPTVEEATSLLESSVKDSGLYIDPLFSNKQGWIWTGDKYGSEAAWGVAFRRGHVFWGNVRTRGYVRPVRSMK